MFRKPTPPPPPPPTPPAEVPARRITDASLSLSTVIGPGTRIRGSVTGGDSLDLAGALEGDAQITGLCRVREGGRMVGDMKATVLVLEGEVSATVLVADKVEIGAGARVKGDVRAQWVAIAEGALFDGNVHMEGRSGEPVAFREKRKGRRAGEDPTTG